MSRTAPSDVTRLLQAWEDGDPDAFGRLYPLVYGELRRLAQSQMRGERDEHTLQATALVHEAFLRLSGQRQTSWRSRGHFLAIAAKLMRRILVDHARRRAVARRGGDWSRTTLDASPERAARPDGDVLAVHEALEGLAALDPRKAQIVELRFFGGLRIEETARALGVSPGTVMRDWTLAKAWLQREIRG